MHVVATAGHVDHGKSTLVRALTGMEPDRWAEERRRGLTIDLGYAWTTLPSGGQVAFVDVPGHERFVTNMLAGVGPVPAVMFVVAADEGWMPQSEEHLRAVAALGVRHMLLVVTKVDLAAPQPALAHARERLAAAGLPPAPHVSVSAATGSGLDELRTALDALVSALPAPDVRAPVRLWVDRVFTVRGAGTVVTGTLPAGTVKVEDELLAVPGGRRVVVRGMQSLNEPHPNVGAVARVALNLRGVERDGLARGTALVTPGAWTAADEVDVLVDNDGMPAQVLAHIGSVAVPAHLRPLGGKAVRLRLAEPLALHLGDRLLLRDPGSRRLCGADVADLHPQPLRRRGDAKRVGHALRVPITADDQVARRRWCTGDELHAAGLTSPPTRAVRAGDWWVDPQEWRRLSETLRGLVTRVDLLSAGVPLEELRRALDLPDTDLVVLLTAELDDLTCADGRVRPTAQPGPDLPALEPLLARLRADPFDAPDAAELAAFGLDRAELAHAVRAGLLLRLTEGVFVAPEAPARAVEVLASADGAFTVSQARELLGSSRRVVVPLLEHLDATRRTRRLDDGARLLVSRPA